MSRKKEAAPRCREQAAGNTNDTGIDTTAAQEPQAGCAFRGVLLGMPVTIDSRPAKVRDELRKAGLLAGLEPYIKQGIGICQDLRARCAFVIAQDGGMVLYRCRPEDYKRLRAFACYAHLGHPPPPLIREDEP